MPPKFSATELENTEFMTLSCNVHFFSGTPLTCPQGVSTFSTIGRYALQPLKSHICKLYR